MFIKRWKCYILSCYSIRGMCRFNKDIYFDFLTLFFLKPAYARKAFPCFDEPSFKATFDITIVGDKNKTVLSNMVNKINKKQTNSNSMTLRYFIK